jgi:putative transposase
MSDNNVIKLTQPGAFTDSLTEILRSGARALLIQAVESEVAEFLAKHTDLKTETGQQRVVRHGHLPQREIMTGIGPIAIRQPRVRDREAAEPAGFSTQSKDTVEKRIRVCAPVTGAQARLKERV